MSPTRRLHGVAALSAAALATAGVAGQGIAADECADLDCLIDQLGTQMIPTDAGLLSDDVGLDFVRSMLEAQGLPPEAIDQTMAIYEQVYGMDGGGREDLADAWPAKWYSEMITAFGGEEIPEEVLVKLEGMYSELGLDPDLLFASLEPGAEALIKMGDAGATPDEVFAKIEMEPDVIDQLGALNVAEAALAQAVANGDIDQATLDAILLLLHDA